MPNCEVALYKQGQLVKTYHHTRFFDDFNGVVKEAVDEVIDTKPDMAIVWLGLRPFGFWVNYRYGFNVIPMVFLTVSKLILSGTDLTWPVGCYVNAIPAFNQPGWYEDCKFFIDHPFRTRSVEHSGKFGIDTEPESMLISSYDLGRSLLYVTWSELKFD